MSWLDDLIYMDYIQQDNKIVSLLEESDEALVEIVVDLGFYRSDFTEMVESICRQFDSKRKLSKKQRKVLALYIINKE